jgi:hypothetical protein
MNKCERPGGKAELVVYSCHCVDHGPEQRVFDEDDIRAAGGIIGVETELQRDCYWFVRLGMIEAQQGSSGWSFTDEAIAELVVPNLSAWRLGRRNPASRRGAFERHVFETLFLDLSAFLKGWNHEEEGSINAYVIKRIDISPDRISSIASALTPIRRAHDVVDMTVLKYWYDPDWKITYPSEDLILAELSVSIPVRLRLDGAEGAIVTDILPSSSC